LWLIHMLLLATRITLFPYTTLFRSLKVALLGSEWVLYVLAFLSMLSFTIMAERFFFFRKHRGDVEELGKLLSAELTKGDIGSARSEEHTSELQSRENLVCRLLLEKN